MSRNTVDRLLGLEEPPCYARHAKGSSLNGFEADIVAIVDENPGGPATVILERAGALTGPEVVAPGGRRYRAGDRIVTLAPGPAGAWVTSQTAQVTAVDTTRGTLTACTPDGRQLHLGRDATSADRLAHGYAMTAHRAQGATVDTAHVLDDGGGRELAYVAMSRARDRSQVYVTASSLQDAVGRLSWAWDDERRHHWAVDQARAAERLKDLAVERDRLVATIPPDVTGKLADARAELTLHEASSGETDAARPLLARIAGLDEAATARSEYLRAHPQVLARIREIDRSLGEQRRTVS